jgi:hypothetical protein
VVVPLVEHPYGVDYDRNPNERLKKVEEFEHESQGNVTTIGSHL